MTDEVKSPEQVGHALAFYTLTRLKQDPVFRQLLHQGAGLTGRPNTFETRKEILDHMVSELKAVLLKTEDPR